MSQKDEKIAQIARKFAGQPHDPHYLAYFDLFNRGLFYEAHEVLEKIWLPQRKNERGDFYKGLIQLAGAFVHLQKNRLRPAAALFKLAQTNLDRYGQVYEGLKLLPIRGLITQHLDALAQHEENSLRMLGEPRIALTVDPSEQPQAKPR